MKINVIIIPEPHIWDKSFKNRYNYPEEIYGYLTHLVEQIKQLDGEKIIIFPGDIFHRGFVSVSAMTRALSLFLTLNEITNGRVYSCVGNHELSFNVGNPFWMLAHDNTGRFPEMQGLDAYSVISQGLQIVDNLTVGPLTFVFGHYGRKDYTTDLKGDCVLITHNSLLEPSIDESVNMMHKTESVAQYMNCSSLFNSGSIPLSDKLKYVFVGHMHTYHSSFDVDEKIDGIHLQFLLQYLGSLGRTAVTEVNDNDLDRTIPVFVVNDVGYVYKPITMSLKSYHEVVNIDVVKANKEDYNSKKAVNELKETNVFGETPLECIERQLQATPEMLTLFSRIYYNSPDQEIQELIKEAQNI